MLKSFEHLLSSSGRICLKGKSRKNTKRSRLQHLHGEPRQGLGFGQFLCAPPRFWPILRPKPPKMFLRSPPNNWNHGTAKRKKSREKKQNRPMIGKNQRNVPVLRRAFAGKENTKTRPRTNATSQDGRTCCCLRMSSKTSPGKVC